MNDRGSDKGSPGRGEWNEGAKRAARLGVAAAAAVIGVLPITAWAITVLPIYRSTVTGAFPLMYLPARVLGLLGFVLMFYQFILSSHLGFLDAAFTRPVMVRRHRSLGKIGFVLMLAHGILILGFDLVAAGMIPLDLPRVLGITALALILVAVVVAWFFKPLKIPPRTWMRIHRLSYVVFPIVFIHAIIRGTTVNSSRPLLWLFAVLLGIYAIVLVRRLVRWGAGLR